MTVEAVENSELLVEQTGPVLTVTFNRPAQRNAMTFAMYDGLHAACERADAEEEVRVLVDSSMAATSSSRWAWRRKESAYRSSSRSASSPSSPQKPAQVLGVMAPTVTQPSALRTAW